MRKFLLILTIIVVFVVSGICGYYIYKAGTDQNESKINIDEIAKVAVENGINSSSPSLATSYTEEKVSPNATLIIKKHYKECGHTTKDYAEIPEELVNRTRKQVEQTYSDWEIRGFSPNEIVILKEVGGICNEHYVLREKDGKVVIYTQDANGKESINEITEISTEYLTEDDKAKLKEGIKATGKEELNSLIEDYE